MCRANGGLWFEAKLVDYGSNFGEGWGPKSTYNGGYAMSVMAGATTVGELAGAIGIRAQEAGVVAELKAGSEEAYAWLIGEFHQPIYSLVYRMATDPADAADTTQEVFLKVFRGIKHFHGESSLKTWIYRIAVHEASNRRRWWFRHKAKETSMEPLGPGAESGVASAIKDSLVDGGDSPFDHVAHEEVRARVEQELRQVSEPYRTTLILRDLEEMSYEEIAEVTQVSLGTVKSRLTRGREALRQRLTAYVQEVGSELGLRAGERIAKGKSHSGVSCAGREFEVVS
jgi:RNA polymerase sigma-70 factor (ECF subfamily)